MAAITNRSSLVILVGGIAVTVAVGVGLYLWGPFAGSAAAPPEEPPPLAPVKWMKAREFRVKEWTELVGTAQPPPERAARITAPLEGRVLTVLQGSEGKPIAEGQKVSKGDVIVQLDSTIAQANRAKSAAAQEELKQQTKQAEIAVKVANIDVMRLAELGKTTGPDKQPLVSRIESEKAKLALEDAEAKLKAAGARELSAAKELAALDEQLKLYSLAAPIDGRLGRLMVVPGQTLAVGTWVTDVVNVEEEIDVLCFVPPAIAAKLAVGQQVRIGGIGDPPGKADPRGQLVYLADQAEPDTGNFAVKVRFPNQDLGLRSNTTVRVRVLSVPGKTCLTLPMSAVFEDTEPPTVIVVDDYKVITKEGKPVETGKAHRLQVTLGVRDRTLGVVEILALQDTDKENPWTGTLETALFVVERGRGLRNGDLIRLEVDED